MKYFYFISIFISVVVVFIPFLVNKQKEIKLRKEFTIDEKINWYSKRSTNKKLSFNQREKAKEKVAYFKSKKKKHK